VLSSATIYLAAKSFKARNMHRYRALITVTAALGLLFIVLQWAGFRYVINHGVKIIGEGSNPAGSFLGVITGLHMLHVLGGVVALIVLFFRAYSSRTKSYSALPIEVMSIYWHFVDLLWIYLFVFYNWLA
jgi:cytochrome c oxidase subunit 3